VSEVGGINAGPLANSVGTSVSPSNAAAFSPGDKVVAELIEALSKTQGIWKIGEQLFKADHPPGLAQGAKLNLRVVSNGPPLQLKLDQALQSDKPGLPRPPAQGAASCVENLLTASGEGLTEAENALLSSLASFINLPEDAEPLAQALARWVGNCIKPPQTEADGPRDAPGLKAILSAIAKNFPEGKLPKAAEALLLHLGIYQARSIVEDAALIPFVLPWGENYMRGEIRIENDSRKNKQGGPRSATLLITVQMPRLGTVEAKISLGEAGLSIKLFLGREFLEETKTRLPELVERLSSLTGVKGKAFRTADVKVEPLLPPTPGKDPDFLEIWA